MVGGNLILTYQNIIKAGNMWETLYLINLFPPLVKVSNPTRVVGERNLFRLLSSQFFIVGV